MLLIAENYFRKLSIKSQIIIIQSLFIIGIALIWMLTITLSLYYYSEFMSTNYFESLITRSFANNMETQTKNFKNIIDVDFQYYAKIDSYGSNIYQFMKQNFVQLNYENDDCLQREDYQQYYSQFCYGTYGNSSNIDDTFEIDNFNKLINVLLPFFTDYTVKQFFTFSLDDSFYYSQNNPKYLQKVNFSIQDGRQQIKDNNLTYFLSFSSSDLYWYTFHHIDDYVFGYSSYQGSDNINLILTNFYENICYVIDKNGYIMYNNKNLTQQGIYFYDEMLTGFNENNFNQIMKIIENNQSNGCQNQRVNIICVQNQLIFYQKYQTPLFTYYFLLIMDENNLFGLKIDLVNKIKGFNYSFLIDVTIIIIITFSLCFVLQFIIVQTQQTYK